MNLMSYIVERALILIPTLNVLGLSADSVIQGVLVTGAAVYGNQVVKQLKKDN